METTKKTMAALAAVAFAGAAMALAPQGDGALASQETVPEAVEADGVQGDQDGAWHIRASGARIIGGYGDNFAYGGEGVRPLEGTGEARIDPESGTGTVTIELRTTEASGPIHFSKDTKWTGSIEIVQKLNTEEMGQARIAEEVFLHGDTGNEAPVMPRIYNYFATWGPSKIMVNGQEAVPMIGSHTMFSEQARGEDGKIKRGSTIYHPMKVDDKTGFTDADELEFHYVAHTTEPDQDNFPPHTAWIHLHFSDVEILSKPEGAEVPYAAGTTE
jgi:hypothetical protein